MGTEREKWLIWPPKPNVKQLLLGWEQAMSSCAVRSHPLLRGVA